MFYARGVIETVKKLRWDSQVIQCMGWISALAPLYLRHKYADEPAFAQAKVVYTLRDDAFEGTLDSRFVEKLRGQGFSDEDLAVLGTADVDYATLTKIAIDNSDALVVTTENVDPAVLEYARQSGKPMLEYPGDDKMVSSLVEFYHQLGVD